MRTHFLERLDIPGQAQVLQKIPGFDLYHLREVERFEWSSGTSSASVTLVIGYDGGLDKLIIRLTCASVRMFRLPSVTGVFTINELEIEDMRSNQLEGIRYRLKDYGESDFEILCGDIAIQIAND